MDKLKRKLQSDSPSEVTADGLTKTTAESSATATMLKFPPKRMKSESADCCCSNDDVDDEDHDDDDSPSTQMNKDSADSIGINPASMMMTMAQSQWRDAKSEISKSLGRSLKNHDDDDDDDDDDGDIHDMKIGLVPASGAGPSNNFLNDGDDDDGDVNLVFNLLMQKVCLESWIITHHATFLRDVCWAIETFIAL